MSFDETQQMDTSEINLVELFRNIWFYKFSLLVILILSVPVSVMYSTTLAPTYRAETVFERPHDKGTQGSSLLSNIEGLGPLILGREANTGANGSFYSEIRSESFLKTVILDNANLDNQLLQEFCPLPSKKISRFSLRALLISLGLSENKAPSKSQETSLLVQCVNKMLEVEFDSPESSAYRLSIESKDPNFSANLANQIVENYFFFQEKKRDQGFKNVKEYLSKIITEAQLEFIAANKLIQSFKIKHSLLMNINSSANLGIISTGFGDGMQIPASPFLPELNKEIAHLSQLEKSLNELKKANLNLSNLKELNRAKIKTFISSTEAQGVFSRAFTTAISKINNLSVDTSLTNQEITKIVSKELMSLNQQIIVLEKKVGKREEQTMKLMTIENRFQELAIDVAKKQLIFEGLKDQLKEKILMTGLASVEQPVLLTKAVPPFGKASPNKKLIVVLGIILSFFFGVAYILIRQISLKRVHSLSQLQRTSSGLKCYAIKYKQLKQKGKTPDETVIDQSFFSDVMGMGKLGCIIDISHKRESYLLASELSKAIANLLVTDDSKIVCLESSPSKKSFTSSVQKSFVNDSGNLNVKGVAGKNIPFFNDEDAMISAGEVIEIKNKYSDYNKIFCALGAEISDLTKFKFIEKCDFYVLIGRSFHFDEYTYKKFSSTVWEKEKKCLGFFLIE